MASHDQQPDIPVPGNLNQVEELIHELYRPNPPQKIAKIQEGLQKLQRSPEGWQLASLLLENADEKVKFFGALTFTVKLNSDSSTLGDEDARQLLSKLIGWLIEGLKKSGGALVSRKLCSTLVVYFLQYPSTWSDCVHHLVSSLAAGTVLSLDQPKESSEIKALVDHLSGEATQVALWFCTMLAEEVGKTDANNIKHHKFHDHLKRNVDDVVAIILPCLKVSPSSPTSVVLRQDSMKCFHAWVLYSHRAYIDGAYKFDSLKSLTQPAMACLIEDDMYSSAIELFCDILGNYSAFLKKDDFILLTQLLNSDWARNRYERLVAGDYEFEHQQFGQFMLAYGDATVQELAKHTDQVSQQFLTALGGLLMAEGFAVAEDLIFVQALEFWATFVEVLVDSLYSEEGAEAYLDEPSVSLGVRTSEGVWFGVARDHVVKAIECCWRKIQFPLPDEFENWDSVEKTGFSDARKDVADLLQASYTLIGSSLFTMFATLAMNSIDSRAWGELEASLYCLGSLSECIDEGECDDNLASIFGSALFITLSEHSSQIPPRTRQSALSLIGQYDTYFHRHNENLPAALTFLFQAIAVPELAVTASKSIHSLCSSCRQVLGSEMNAFLQQYLSLSQTVNVDGLVKERIVGGIAAIIQALPLEVEKFDALMKLIQLSENDAGRCLGLLSTGDLESAQAEGVEVLRCLTSLAKGMQAPNDIPIDIELMNPENTRKFLAAQSFWADGPRATFKERVLCIVDQLMSSFSTQGEIVEAACSVFRAGFTEWFPGPFVFSAESVAKFIIAAHPSTPRLGAIISVARSFVCSQVIKAGEVNDILVWVLAILQHYSDPSHDPEISQTGIDFVGRLIPTHLDELFAQPSSSLEYFFMFCLKALSGRDPLPKSAAAEFWSSFVSLQNLEEPLHTSMSSMMEQLGPLLAQALVHNISGHAARSELDKLCEPLKKLVVKQIRAKSWLETALQQVPVSGSIPKEAEKRVFLQKVINLRGSRQTNQVVKDFWLTCRGSSFAYVS